MTEDDGQPTAGDVRAGELSERLLGVEPLRVWATSSPDAKFAELPGGRQVVIKGPGWRNQDRTVLGEAWIYRECRRRDVLVPTVVAVSQDPVCLIVERLPGASLADQPVGGSSREAWAAAGEDLRRLREIRLPGFGPLLIDHEVAHGEAVTWCPYAEFARTRGMRRLVDRGLVDHAAGDRLIRLFDEAAPRFAAVSDGRLLHGDLTSGHVFHDSTGYRGMIDFGQAQVGDPRWDLARVRLWDGDEALDALLDGYGLDAVSSEDREFLLPLYLFAYVCHHAAEHPDPGYIRTVLERSGYRALL
jgi:aminoglycoside phosphotransferase